MDVVVVPTAGVPVTAMMTRKPRCVFQATKSAIWLANAGGVTMTMVTTSPTRSG